MPLAVECGFDSHSHATAACRQVFGQPPSRLRQAPAARDAGGLGQLQMRTILKA
jgi:AraC-like DNA-binding protein